MHWNEIRRIAKANVPTRSAASQQRNREKREVTRERTEERVESRLRAGSI